MGRIQGVTTLEEAAEDADFVIESIAEDLKVKQEVFAKLHRICSVLKPFLPLIHLD
jgi:3-hydroxybutyryl-CoA dehydrogenase